MRVSQIAHGTTADWHTGCRFTQCRRAHSDAQRTWWRARTQERLPIELQQQLLDAIDAGQPFRQIRSQAKITQYQVWGLTKTDEEWSTALEAALTATRRGDLQHGTNAAYVRGCVCSECREHQRIRIGGSRANPGDR